MNGNNKCSNCGGDVVFNELMQTWICGNCGSQNLVEVVENENKEENFSASFFGGQSSNKLFKCSSCGSKFVTSANVMTNCLYCDSLLEQSPNDSINPQYIIPFKNDKDAAIKIYKKYTRFRFFIPFKFRKKDYINKISNVYVPFYVTDLKYNGNVLFGASSSKKWNDDKFNYDETKIYDIVCEGTLEYNNNIVSNSNIIEQEIINYFEPFDFINKVNYEDRLIANNYVEGVYNISDDKLDTTKKKIINRATNMMSELINHEKKGIKKNNMIFSNGNSFYVLLPMWILTYKYQDKNYKFILSDSNDKVYMNLPNGIKEKIIVGIATFMFIFIVSFLISYFF